MTKSKFRWLLTSGLLLTFAATGLEVAQQLRMPDDVTSALDKLAAAIPAWRLVLGGVAGLIALVVGIIAYVGFYLFKAWAPGLAINCTLLSVLAVANFPPALSGGYGAALTMLAGTVWGAIIAFSKTEFYSIQASGR